MTTQNILKLAHTYPHQAEAILALIHTRKDRAKLMDFLNTCTCTLDTDRCICVPELG
jgi:hypothetical protein